MKLAVGRFIALNGDFPRDEMVGGFCVVYTVRPQYGNWRSKKKRKIKKEKKEKKKEVVFFSRLAVIGGLGVFIDCRVSHV